MKLRRIARAPSRLSGADLRHGQLPRRVCRTTRSSARVRDYIKKSWTTLTRSNRDLPQALPDPKMPRPPGQPLAPLRRARRSPRARRGGAARACSGDDATKQSRDPHAAAGRRCRSASTACSTCRARTSCPAAASTRCTAGTATSSRSACCATASWTRARDMVDNFVYEITHYGTILNANRTLLPLALAAAVPDAHDPGRLRADRRPGRGCAARCRPSSATTGSGPPSRTSCPDAACRATSTSATGPAPEVVSDEKDAAGRTHYDRAREYYRTHDVTDYDEALYYDSARDQLTDLFYKGDRSMRESGFDPSNRFGALNVDVIHYAPVCLNTLLYVMEDDAAAHHDHARRCGGGAHLASAGGRRGATASTACCGTSRPGSTSTTTSGPAGCAATTSRPRSTRCGRASPRRRRRRACAGTSRASRRPGGLLTSTTVTGNQWDAPFGWAPLQMIAVDGLRRYGFHEDADRLALKFVALVAKEFDGARHDRREVRRAAARVGRRRGHQVRLQRQPDRLRLDQRRRAGAAGRRATAGRALSAGRRTTPTSVPIARDLP